MDHSPRRSAAMLPRALIVIDGIAASEGLLQLGYQWAQGQLAPWTAAFVDTGAIGLEQRASVEKAFELAEHLGGQTRLLRGHDAAAELLAYARTHDVTHIIVGRPRRGRLSRILRPALGDRLLRLGGDLAISVAPSENVTSHGPKARRWAWGRASEYLSALIVVAACVLISSILQPLLPLANLSLVFLVGVLVLAVRIATVPAVVTALLSATAYNFFFTEPFYSFHMYNTGELLTVGFFLLVGLLAGQMAGRLRRQMQTLRTLNEQNQTLADLNRRLASAPDVSTMAVATAETLSERFHVPVRVLLARPAADAMLEKDAAAEDVARLDSNDPAAQWALEHRRVSGRFTNKFAGSAWRFLPLHSAERAIGVIAIRFPDQPPTSADTLDALDVLAGQVSLAMTRARLAEDLEKARITEETERLRSALLSSVSHDLRTPLASMIGSATSLRDLHGDLSETNREELLDAIVSEGERLNRYIQNLLDMTRLGHGGLDIARDWIGFDDILNSALRRTQALLAGIRVVRSVDPLLPLLYLHPALIEQALVNIIENAARFSPVGGEISITATLESGEVHIIVSDQGPGIPLNERRKVFEMHFTGGSVNGDRHGGGLGLTISAGMIGAHMGRVMADEGPDGTGTSIHIYLPAVAPPPADGARE